MSYGTSVDPTLVLLSYLYNHASWPRVGEASAATAIALYAYQLPPGWSLSRSILLLPDDETPAEILPEFYARITAWVYGSSTYYASLVERTLFDLLRDSGTASVTYGGGTVYLGPSERLLGPYPYVEPETGWPRVISSYQIYCSEFAVV